MSLLAENARWSAPRETAQKTQVSSGPTLAITSALDADVPTDAVSSPSEGNRQLLTFFFLTTTHTLLIISFCIPIIATEDTNEDDTQEVTSQTSPIVQVIYLSIYHSLTFVWYLHLQNQIQCLPSKKARTIPSPAQVTQSLPLFDPILYLIQLYCPANINHHARTISHPTGCFPWF